MVGPLNEQTRHGRMMTKRIFDLIFSVSGVLVLSPLLLLLAAAVKLSSCGPVLFRQQRVGKNGKPFVILKFRSMIADAEKFGPSITRDRDPRITILGRFLRKTKLDELPQLWNVLLGDMSFVGPRPEVPRYVKQYTTGQAHVLALKPGITDPASLEFREEETLLASVADPERFYVEYCLPRKIELNLAYAATANLKEDVRIIFRTIRVLTTRRGHKTRQRQRDVEPVVGLGSANAHQQTREGECKLST